MISLHMATIMAQINVEAEFSLPSHPIHIKKQK